MIEKPIHVLLQAESDLRQKSQPQAVIPGPRSQTATVIAEGGFEPKQVRRVHRDVHPCGAAAASVASGAVQEGPRISHSLRHLHLRSEDSPDRASVPVLLSWLVISDICWLAQ